MNDLLCTACSEGYLAERYQRHESSPGQPPLNTSLCEQWNSEMRFLKVNSKWMSLKNFMSHVRLFIAMKNLDRKTALLH